MPARRPRLCMHPGFCDHVAVATRELATTRAWFEREWEYTTRVRGRVAGVPLARLSPPEAESDGATLELLGAGDTGAEHAQNERGLCAVRVPDIARAVDGRSDRHVDQSPVDLPGIDAVIHVPGGVHCGLIERDAGPAYSIAAACRRVNDLEQVVDWYTRALGYHVIERATDGPAAWLAHPDGSAAASTLCFIEHPTDSRPFAGGHIGLACHDIDAFTAELRRAAGFAEDLGPRCGGTHYRVRSPGGVPLEFVERPPPPNGDMETRDERVP